MQDGRCGFLSISTEISGDRNGEPNRTHDLGFADFFRNCFMFAAVVVTSFNNTPEIGRICGILTWVMALRENAYCEGVWMGNSW